MMKRFILLTCFLLSFVSNAQKKASQLPLIPLPNSITEYEGSFKINAQTKVVLNDPGLMNDVNSLTSYLHGNYGFMLQLVKETPGNGNYISFEKPDWEAGWPENYHLTVDKDHITIMAEGNGSGFFYGIQTLIQMLPVQDERTLKEKPMNEVSVPCVVIKDSPRYSWRGMHLDVCRHFMPKDFVKRYIDLLALYKMNVFHWHLSDDQGWRIEIKKYPLLTQKASYRSGTAVGLSKDNKYDTLRHGGFYTQDEIREIVGYAQSKHITVVPEIEMPGHSVAAISAYPFLSCSRKAVPVARGWGVFDEVLCPRDSTFRFLEDVLTEVMSLFPGKYIHIGGDECTKESWKKCPDCQARMKSENLKNEHELQSYFIRRIETFVNSKGRQIIGWDEILEGGLAPNATVMSWRGTEGGIAAARQKHTVVMSPGKPCYFDHYQSRERGNEPLAIGGFNPLDSVYAYDPTPKVLSNDEKKYILGAQGNVWTEYIVNEKQVEYMAVPRMCALAEVLWTEKNKKNYPNFIARLKQHAKLLDRMQVNYAKHFLNKK